MAFMWLLDKGSLMTIAACVDRGRATNNSCPHCGLKRICHACYEGKGENYNILELCCYGEVINFK